MFLKYNMSYLLASAHPQMLNAMQKPGHSISFQFFNDGFSHKQGRPGGIALPEVSKILLTSPKSVDKNAEIFA
jgi:hypothetical protein